MSTDVHRYINNNNNMKKIFLKNLDGDLVSLDYVKRITFHKENYLMLDRNGGQLWVITVDQLLNVAELGVIKIM